MIENITALSVTELNNQIKNLIDSDEALAAVAVMGELSNYKIYSSGHHYFTLKDSESSLRCVMFRPAADKLRFRPENGMVALALGRVSVFPRDGAYQLYCTAISPTGYGDLSAAFEQLKKKLRDEGLFSPEHKKPLPKFPDKIAVVTSGSGAAIHDIIRILNRRWPLSKVLVLPVRVQGETAPAEISGAIRYCNLHKISDLIITGRGGGSIEDLWAFNDEKVARAIFDSDIPIISAVGHEPDVTISDYVADLRAATPSNAAELAVPDRFELKEALLSYQIRLSQALRKTLSDKRIRLKNLYSRRVVQNPEIYFQQRRQALDYSRSRLDSAMDAVLSKKRSAFSSGAASLNALSPLNVLSRGYSIAETRGGEVIRSVSQITGGDKLQLLFSDGKALCTAD